MTDEVYFLPGGGARRDLIGLRVLLVEDEMLLSMMIEDWLTDEGCVVVGPAATLQRAELLAGTAAVDVAILDVNIRGEKAYAVADILAARGIPFMFSTGYSVADLEERFHGIAMLHKPFRAASLAAALRTAASPQAAM